MATWDTNFEASPANADPPSQGAGKIRETRVETADRGNKEHTWGGTVAADGVHRAGSAKIYFTTATPVLQPDGATGLGVADKGRLWMSNSGAQLHVLSNTAGSSAWVANGVGLVGNQTIYGIKTFASTLVHGHSTSYIRTTGVIRGSTLFRRLTTAIPDVGDSMILHGTFVDTYTALGKGYVVYGTMLQVVRNKTAEMTFRAGEWRVRTSGAFQMSNYGGGYGTYKCSMAALSIGDSGHKVDGLTLVW